MSKEIQLIPSQGDMSTLMQMGTMAVKSGFLPTSIKTVEQAVIIALKGRELGIPPMQAFSSISVINGKPCLGSELMLALVYKHHPQAVVNFLESTNEVCKLEAKRPGGKMCTWTFTIDDAKRAGLLGKGPWQQYPGNMLRWRCISNMCKAVFPDAVMGCYTPEEMGANVNEEGEIIDVPQQAQIVATPVEA